MNWFACYKCGDVIGGNGHEALASFAGGPGDVGGEGEFFGAEEGIRGEDGFGGDDIASGTGDAVGVEGIGEGLLVDERAAGDVHEKGRGLHSRERGSGDQALGFWGKRAVEGYEIGFLQNLIGGRPCEGEGGLRGT